VAELRSVSLKVAVACLSLVVLLGTALWFQFHREHTATRQLVLSSARTAAARIDAHLADLEHLLRNISIAVSTNPGNVDSNDAVLRRIQSELPKSIANILLLTLEAETLATL
jgi:hypothetical protein